MIREPIPSPKPIEITKENTDAIRGRFWRLEPILSIDEAGTLVGITGNALRLRIGRGALDMHIVSRGDRAGIRRSDMLSYITTEQARLNDAVKTLRDAA